MSSTVLHLEMVIRSPSFQKRLWESSSLIIQTTLSPWALVKLPSLPMFALTTLSHSIKGKYVIKLPAKTCNFLQAALPIILILWAMLIISGCFVGLRRYTACSWGAWTTCVYWIGNMVWQRGLTRPCLLSKLIGLFVIGVHTLLIKLSRILMEALLLLSMIAKLVPSLLRWCGS